MRYSGRDFKILVENVRRELLKEFINNNVNAPWRSNVVSKSEIEDAIDNQDTVYVNYTTDEKGEHERAFIPTSVMYSSIKNRYRVLGWDPNKSKNDGRVAFILDKISDWQDMDLKDRKDNQNETSDNTEEDMYDVVSDNASDTTKEYGI